MVWLFIFIVLGPLSVDSLGDIFPLQVCIKAKLKSSSYLMRAIHSIRQMYLLLTIIYHFCKTPLELNEY